MKNNPRQLSKTPSLIALAISQMLLASSPSQAATINVDPPGTPGGCTIVEAINTANSTQANPLCGQGGGADIINLPANTIFNLSSGFYSESDELNALPAITSPVTINGNGSTLQLDSQYLNDIRIMEIIGDVNLFGSVTINDVTIAKGALTSRYTNGAGIRAVNTSVILVNSIISNNTTSDGSGGGISAENTTLELHNTTVTNNQANLYAGGIFLDDGSSLSVYDSNIANNSGLNGGAIGAINNSTIEFRRSTVSGNSSIWGGGAIATVRSHILLQSSTISENSAGTGGGGISARRSSSVQIINSTLSSNTATTRGGGIHLDNDHYSFNSSLTIYNSTIVNNQINYSGTLIFADSGGGLYVTDEGMNTINIVNTAIANNGNLINDCGGVKPGPGIGNWFEDASCSAGFGYAQGDPKLGSLQFNGGPTKTHAPLPGSGLDGSGFYSKCSLAPVSGIDQRGRPRNNPCFIGAVEGIVDPASFFVVPLPNGKSVIFSL